MVFLAWLTRLLISIAAGAGAGCLTFGVIVMTTFRSSEWSRVYVEPQPVPIVLGIGIGLIVSAGMMWLLSRRQLASSGDLHAKRYSMDASP
jgi:hypothetical protein